MAFQFSLNSVRYEDVRQQIVDFLTSRGEYSAQFDYQGSNLAYVIDSMAYATMLMSYQLSQVANNVFLDTTEIRKNAVSIAKTIGYVPKRKVSSKFIGTLKHDGNVNLGSTASVTISPKSTFTSTSGRSFTNLDTIVFKPDADVSNPKRLTADFVIFEGSLRKMEVLADGTAMQSFVVPSRNVAEDYLKVYVRNTADPDSAKVEWKHVKTFFDATEKQIFFVEEDRVWEGMPRITFGNDLVGQVPTASQTIVVEWLETVGAIGNGEASFSLPSDPSVYHETDLATYVFDPAAVVIPTTVSNSGSDLENLASVQVNAPRYYAAAGRGVTAGDYRTLGSSFKNVRSFNVIGGDELFPKDPSKLGNSYFTGIPALLDDFLANNKLYLNELEENEVLGRAKEMGVIATRKEFVKPTYILVTVTPYVETPQNASASDVLTTKNAVVSNLKQHFADRYTEPGVPFRSSKLMAAIDNTAGVVSSYATMDYELVLNYDSFYYTRENRCYLPVIAVRNPDGSLVSGEFTNFVKTNVEIARELGVDVANLRPDQSSVYGKITHPTLERYLYSSDLVHVELFQLREFSDGTLSASSFPYVDSRGIGVTPTLGSSSTSGGSTTWGMFFSDSPLVNRGSVVKVGDSVSIVTLQSSDQYFASAGFVKRAGSFFSSKKVMTTTGDTYWSIGGLIASNMSNLVVSGKKYLMDFTGGTTPKLVAGTDASGVTTPFDSAGNIATDPTFTVVANASKWIRDVDATNKFSLPTSTAADGDVVRVVKSGDFELTTSVDNAGLGFVPGELLQLRGLTWFRCPVVGTLDATDASSLPAGPQDGGVYTIAGNQFLFRSELLPGSPWTAVTTTGATANGLFALPPKRSDWMHQIVIVGSTATQTGSVAELLGVDLMVGDVLYFDPASGWKVATTGAAVDPLSIPGAAGSLPMPSSAVLGEVVSVNDRGNFVNYASIWFEGGSLPTVDLDDLLICVKAGASYVWRKIDSTDMSKNLDTTHSQSLPIGYDYGSTIDVVGDGSFESYFAFDIHAGESLIFDGSWKVYTSAGPAPSLPDGIVYEISKKGDFGTSTTYYPGDLIVSYGSSWKKVNPFSAELIKPSGFELYDSDLRVEWSETSGQPIYRVVARDTLDEVSIATFDYLTGEVKFEDSVLQHFSTSSASSVQVKNVFNYYSGSDLMDRFSIVPVNKSNGDTETDFDTRFNQSVKSKINAALNKAMLQG